VIVLDTHVAVWMTNDKHLLSEPAAAAIREASRQATGLAIASSTLWEVAMMSTNGQFRLRRTLAEYLSYLESIFVVLPINAAIAQLSVSFSENYPRNPMDRLIGATAIAHSATLVTKDERIRASGEVNCIW
jgi:PIN domain nuclease of toxin-antitoxin system